MNPLVVAVLESPVHWLLSVGLTVITVTGRRTGRRYRIPVGYNQFDDVIIILVSDAANRLWWRNYQEAAAIELRLRGRDRHGTAMALPADSDEFERCADMAFRRAGLVARIFGIRYDRRAGLRPHQTAHLGAYARIVKVVLRDPERTD